MAYKLVQFENADLPPYNHEWDLSPLTVQSSLQESIGGTFDYFAGRRRFARNGQMRISGTFAGAIAYLLDVDGAFLADESGNLLIAGDAPQQLREAVETLAAYIGMSGMLWRQRHDDDELQWKNARMLALNHRGTVENRTVLAPIDVTFETLDGTWHAETATTISDTVSAGIAQLIPVYVGGNAPVRDGIISIEAVGTVTAVRVQVAALGVDWSWTDTLAPGETLTIDTDPNTPAVSVDGADQYISFALAAGHSADSWLPLAVGDNYLIVTVTGGSADVAISFYDQWF